jgi:hypothetical protein
MIESQDDCREGTIPLGIANLSRMIAVYTGHDRGIEDTVTGNFGL